MDSYNAQKNYYQYLTNQMENYVDLDINANSQNDSVREFATILFNKKKSDLQTDLSSILIGDDMDTRDIFYMLSELILYGIDIITKSNYSIFDLNSLDDHIVDELQLYMKSCGFNFTINEIIDENLNDYAIQIIKKTQQPTNSVYSGWILLNYKIIENVNFTDSGKLTDYKAYFVNNNANIFGIKFNYHKNV